MYAFNITGDLDEMRRRHDLVLALGGTCVMVSLNSVGLAGMIELGRHAQLPIHAHRNGWGVSLAPSAARLVIRRVAEALAAGRRRPHARQRPRPTNSAKADDSVIASARACLTPLFAGQAVPIMPVFSSGQTARQAPDTYAALGIDRPHLLPPAAASWPIRAASAAGVRRPRQAWEAAIAGVPLDEHAREHRRARRPWKSPP